MSNGSLSKEVLWNPVFCEGWLEYKNTKNGVHYEKIWMILKGNVLYVFNTNNPSSETQIGNLTLDPCTTFHSSSVGSATKGFKFDLHTGRRVNRFKCCKQSERELWRGYISGVATGKIPNNLDLLDSVINKMKDDVNDYKINESTINTLKDHSTRRSNRLSIVSKQDSGVVSMQEESRSLSDTSSRSMLSGGGPTMIHRFYNDRLREQKPPSWFFSPCSREYAELILTKAAEFHYGNTIMRESTSHISNGSYVISKRRWNQGSNRFEFDHFEVMRTAEGYKVNVDNPHAPMNCLKDVMDYFFEASGGSVKPLVTNDRNAFQLDVPNYARKIPTRTSVEETSNWPPSDNIDESNEPKPDYEEPVFHDSPDKHSSNIGPGWRAQSPVMRRQPTPSNSGRKTASQFYTVSGSADDAQSHRRTMQPSFEEFQQRTTATANLATLDNVINQFENESGFEWNAIYVNKPAQDNDKISVTEVMKEQLEDKLVTSFLNVNIAFRVYLSIMETSSEGERSFSKLKLINNYLRSTMGHKRVSSLALPSTESEVMRKMTFEVEDVINEFAQKMPPTPHARASQTANANIPVAPPPPSSSVPSRASAAPPMRNLEIVNQTIPVAPPPPSSPVVVRTTAGTNLRHNVTSLPCLNSWDKSRDIPKDIAIRLKTHGAEGVDTNTPGGVNTLKSKFEPRNDAARLTQQRGHARNSLPVTMSTPSLRSTLPDDIKMNESLPKKTNDDFTNNMHAQLVNRSNSTNTFSTTNIRQENIKFPNHLNWTNNENRNLRQSLVEGSSMLRNSTPTSAVARSACESQKNVYDDTIVPSNAELQSQTRAASISDPFFKEKLEKLFAGVTVSKPPPNFKRPLPQRPDEPSRLYEPTPMQDGQIKPDDVTYYNDNL